MNSVKLRNLFLEYFKQQGHTVVPSDNLIPSGDPTLLFTSAGMVQFKKHFLGQVKLDYKRAATCQKCLRTSDIENIGETNRHLSFFEMLGNFSFGDYFKKEAINWAWEFLVKEAGLDKKRLYITVYKDDKEALEIWREIVDGSRIFKMGEETNYWNMGTTGPCGPCSEILYDRGEKYSCGKDCYPACGCDRYMEVWNLVFTQFDRQPDGSLQPLPRKNIDTGMGFERLLSVVNDVNSPFDTDLFLPIKDKLSDELKCNIQNTDDENRGIKIWLLNTIADHVRAVTFMLAEGILPSNEGRGYILRRLLRRAIYKSAQIKQAFVGKQKIEIEPVLYKVVPAIVQIMGTVYKELMERRENIATLIKLEEEKFLETIEKGEEILFKMIKNDSIRVAGQDFPVLPGEKVFKLYDTYGYPLELTKEIASGQGILIDEKGFETSRNKAQEVAKKSWKGSGEKNVELYSNVLKKTGDTKFTGYGAFADKGIVKAIIVDAREVSSANAPAAAELVMDKTPFYAESGGQAGDTGSISSDTSSIEVKDTIKPVEGLFVHKVKLLKGSVSVGDEVRCDVDEARRRMIMRHHTATHLLHKALRETLGEHVAQSGSMVSPDKLRFDYTHMKAMSDEETGIVEDMVNQAIERSLSVCVIETSLDKARSFGAVALFGEKYGSKVRCVATGAENESSIKDAFSIELCGGTHVNNTSEIGVFKILSDVSVASGVRRIEAVAGGNVLKVLKDTEEKIESFALKLKCKTDEVGGRIERMIQTIKALEHENESLKTRLMSGGGEAAAGGIFEYNGKKIYADIIKDMDIKSVRTHIDKLVEKNNADIGILLTETGFVVKVSEAGLLKGLDASGIARSFADAHNGRAGGRQDFAQGGGKISGITVEKLVEWLKKEVKT